MAEESEVLRDKLNIPFYQVSVALTPEVLAAQDAVVIVTDHSSYDYGMIVAQASLVIDSRNATREVRGGRDNVVLA